MKDTFLNAKLVEPDLIRLVVFSSLSWEKIEPVLITDGVAGKKMTPTRLNTLSTLAIADFRLDAPLPLGHSYFLTMPQYGSVGIDVSEATGFPGFDETYYYDGDDLGANYSKRGTTFVIWAPLASHVVLSVRKPGEKEFAAYDMVREEKGTFRARIAGDLAGAEYHYFVTNSEVTHRTPDPYAKGSIANGRESVVVDFSKLKVDFHRECLPVMESPCDAVIYEAHVRDMTIAPGNDVVHKGRFLGLVEHGRKTKGGHPVGIDYLKEIGITHLQLLPIYDYKTVDELHPERSYNWGYDPAQYFVPEGSYASVLNDPLSRIKDCKAMVAELHKAGIRVVMDVVYNHVFEYEKSTFERVVPNYYFRHRGNGKMAATSGCGDDVASERKMVRKMILDACAHWIDEYGIDGFRFDLMGILDVDTMNAVEALGKSRHKSFIVYGEGWNMGGEVRQSLAHMGNYALMPTIGFFNDFFRESIKSLYCGNPHVVGNAKNVLCGSCTDFMVGAKFLSATQSINYVECHDNATFFDFFAKARGDLDEATRLRVVEAATYTVLLSIGVPFIHMGQEVGLTKYGEENSYNKGDKYNQFDFSLLDARYAMVERFKKVVALRKGMRALHMFDPRVIGPTVAITDFEEVVRYRLVDTNIIAPRKYFEVLINPSAREIAVPVEGEVSDYLGQAKVERTQEGQTTVHVPPHELVIVVG